MVINPTRRRIVIGILTVALVGIGIAGTVWLGRAKAKVLRIQAYGRLSQMRLALHLYERDNGTLPPQLLRDAFGVPSQSWRAHIIPYLGGAYFPTPPDLAQPWDSDHNREIIAATPPSSWVWFGWDHREDAVPVSTRILAYLGRESFWDANTGRPKGPVTEHPNAILLIWVHQSNVHPLQPGDITEEEVRRRIEAGEEVLFIAAGDGYNYGIVAIEQGELVFQTWQQELDRREGRP